MHSSQVLTQNRGDQTLSHSVSGISVIKTLANFLLLFGGACEDFVNHSSDLHTLCLLRSPYTQPPSMKKSLQPSVGTGTL